MNVYIVAYQGFYEYGITFQQVKAIGQTALKLDAGAAEPAALLEAIESHALNDARTRNPDVVKVAITGIYKL
ncbi:hypothetical protein ABLA30_17440 [Xenorhabdus nematophila]|uniref:hypothetical protein n=1 Tax=Xenorhabdus nematophila TaxID=628 RepID=UPI0032B75762